MLAKGPKYRLPKSINCKHNFTIIMDSVDDYARQWANREKEDLHTHSKWVMSLMQIRIIKLGGSMSTHCTAILKEPNIAKHLSLHHDKCVIVLADLDLYLEIEREEYLRTTLYDKKGDFNFPIVTFPFIYSNIPKAPTYGVYISQLIRYSRA